MLLKKPSVIWVYQDVPVLKKREEKERFFRKYSKEKNRKREEKMKKGRR